MDAKLLEQVELLEELNRRNREDKLARYKPYEKQKAWHDMSAEKRCSALLAGNQGGKSYAAAMQVAIFATGRYPEWWQGKRFSSTTRGWVAGISSVGVRDTMQRLLLGPLGNQGTGAIPKDCIEQVRMSRGSPDAVDSILVRHVNGYTSQITFKSYEQGITRLAGETLNYVCMDEEPPADVFSECLARISATRGIVFASFTPLLGMSEIVRRFLDGSNPDYGYVQFALDEAGHFTREEKEKMNIKNCPFCFSSSVEVQTRSEEGGRFSYYSRTDHYYSVKCRSCNASGPEKEEEQQAISAWNSIQAPEKLGTP